MTTQDANNEHNYDNGVETIVEAVEASDVKSVTDMLENGFNVNTVSQYGFPLLVIAAKNNDLPMTAELLKYEPHIDAVDCYGRCALVWAIMNKNPALYSMLLERHKDINAPDNILVFAIAYQEHVLAKYILSKIKNVDTGWIAGKNPLMWAVSLEANDLISDILMKGPVITDLNYSDRENFGDPKIEHYMMELIKDDDPETRRIKEQKFLRKAGIHKFCADNKMVTAYRAIFDLIEGRSYSPDNVMEVIKKLLQTGLKIDIKNNAGRTPLSLYCSNERPSAYYEQDKKIADMFFAAGADVNTTDNDGNTPLHHAISEQYMNMVRILVKKGADPNRVNRFGYTAKDIASLIYPYTAEPLECLTGKLSDK